MRQPTVSIGRRFRSLLSKERFRDLWETEPGLARHPDSLLASSDVVEPRDVRSTVDVGLAHLAQAYEAISLRGMPVTQLYFDTIRQAMLDRIVLRHASRPVRRGLSDILTDTIRTCDRAFGARLRAHPKNTIGLRNFATIRPWVQIGVQD
jgi:hypothetical protein